jgi:hypothetical protein
VPKSRRIAPVIGVFMFPPQLLLEIVSGWLSELANRIYKIGGLALNVIASGLIAALHSTLAQSGEERH